MSKCFFR